MIAIGTETGTETGIAPVVTTTTMEAMAVVVIAVIAILARATATAGRLPLLERHLGSKPPAPLRARMVAILDMVVTERLRACPAPLPAFPLHLLRAAFLEPLPAFQRASTPSSNNTPAVLPRRPLPLLREMRLLHLLATSLLRRPLLLEQID